MVKEQFVPIEVELAPAIVLRVTLVILMLDVNRNANSLMNVQKTKLVLISSAEILALELVVPVRTPLKLSCYMHISCASIADYLHRFCFVDAQCSVINHIPSCYCPPGYVGDPFYSCRPEEKRPDRKNSDFKY